MELYSSTQCNASPHKPSRILPTVSFSDVSGINSHSYLSLYQLKLRIVAQIERTLFSKHNVTPLMSLRILDTAEKCATDSTYTPIQTSDHSYPRYLLSGQRTQLLIIVARYLVLVSFPLQKDMPVHHLLLFSSADHRQLF
ncbi:hypothetical protein TNCV_1857251 [Trichonephila clavipes]|nr:hypothetical protein TNCV_1857251 [Trichonephila clavipes]